MKINLISVSDRKKPADVFFIGYFQDDSIPKEINTLEPEFVTAAKLAIKNGRIKGTFAETFSSYSESYGEAPEIILFGLGKKKNHKHVCFRKTVGHLIQLAKKSNAKTARIFLDSFAGGDVSLSDAAGILSEISLLATYRFDRYQAKGNEKDKKVELATIEALIGKKSVIPSLQKKIDWHRSVAEGVVLTRDLINEPGNVMTAPKLASEAKNLARKKKLTCRILGPAELKQLKMGGILAVNQGSITPPALIILEYGKKFSKKGTVCLVGKGVTFDTGGISIKPAKDMEKMKYDMSGAATVIGTMGVVADLKLPVHVIGLAPAVENNVAHNPQRPGDIIHMANGKTVEVLNTDAEGRLILADALHYSAKFHPKAIIDLATLTGMCAYTFGDKAIGLMGNNEKLSERVKKAGEAVGEKCWELPMWDEYRDQIKGHHSDLYNIGGPYGGTITAAMFLKEFVPENTPWVHLDIAGTAWCDSPRYDCPKGASGVGVRLLTEFLDGWGAGSKHRA